MMYKLTHLLYKSCSESLNGARTILASRVIQKSLLNWPLCVTPICILLAVFLAVFCLLFWPCSFRLCTFILGQLMRKVMKYVHELRTNCRGASGGQKKRKNGFIRREFPTGEPLENRAEICCCSFALRVSANAHDTGRRIIKFVQDDSLSQNSEHSYRDFPPLSQPAPGKPTLVRVCVC